MKYVPSDADGHVIYGPYEGLSPGRYEARFSLKLEEPCRSALENRKCAVLDVVSHFGRLTFARKEVYVRDFDGVSAEFVLCFTVDDSGEFEYRVQALAEIAFSVEEAPRCVRVGDLGSRETTGASGMPSLGDGAVPTILMENLAGFRTLYERGASIRIDRSLVAVEYGGTAVSLSSGDISPAARQFWPAGLGIDVSYAEAEEDVLLLNALRDVSRDDGFYIDVGANDPHASSVTKLFYDRGWRGINIEPSRKWFALLTAARPRDINIQVAVSDAAGETRFFDDPNAGLGTIEKRFAERHREQGYDTQEIVVPTQTMTEICERHATDVIHFLKIDVEGHEAAVIRGLDFARFRPWLLCIEAGEPMNVNTRTYHQWDRVLTNAGYLLARSDYLNRYYICKEQEDRLRFFEEFPRGFIKG